ncbi:DUF3237 family protein [Nocardioides sp. SR21]|uniref:DUF3237 family protein n=1 Tax=Nocardioides sp. SR21 TaxID=2919501 RepID=UPI001FA969EC|nr:DUF3237 family protein [Nocardioides sp. SR21]
MTAVPQIVPELAFAFEARVDIAPSEHIGHAGSAPVGMTPITGGTVSGPRLNGTVVPGGGDWAIARPGVAVDLDARYLIRADDGALIDIVNRGFWVASDEVNERAEAGEPVDPSEYYFRTQPVFRTDAPQHTWLTHTVFVGMAYDDADVHQIRIQFFEVK